MQEEGDLRGRFEEPSPVFCLTDEGEIEGDWDRRRGGRRSGGRG